jgi:hypothetical protein
MRGEHIKHEKGLGYKSYLKNYISKTTRYRDKSRRTRKRKYNKNLKVLSPILEKKERCPNGTRRNKKTSICESNDNNNNNNKPKRKRCPNGTRKNRKTKECNVKK